MTDQTFQLRSVFNEDIVNYIANQISEVYPKFNKQEFKISTLEGFEDLSFGDRSSRITDILEKYLPGNFEEAASILINSLGPELEGSTISGYDGFYIMPLTAYISRRGLDHFELSMKALYEMTKRFTSEGSIRKFIKKYPQESLSKLKTWTKDPNPHVRRLVSEGSRPRLPLSERIELFQKDPRPVIKLLDKLVNDPELYVRRSVANNLNDISKDNPDSVVSALEKWGKKNTSKEMLWLTNHALRTLLKQGNERALALVGYDPEIAIKVFNLNIKPKSINLGAQIEFSFELSSQESQPVNMMIDYIIHFVKKSGKQSKKVFKLSKRKIKPQQAITISKGHSFKDLSTRKHYPGEHQLDIQINGHIVASQIFQVV